MEKNEKTKVQVQPVLKLYLDLSQTNYLHFGMWDSGAELNLPNFQKAQENYAQKLISFVPASTKTVLDVGCGVGGNAIAFTKAGYKVESLSPDPYQQQLFAQYTKGEIPFILTTLEDFKPELINGKPKQYDLLLLSESVQYIPSVDIFRRAAELMAPNGYLLTSDYYKLENARGNTNLPGHIMKDFLEEAKKQGFVIVQEEDITDRILPTLDYGTQVYRNFIKPVLNCILTTMEVHLKPIHWMFMQVLKLKIKGKSLRQIIINNVVPMDRKTFKDNLVYRIILFKKA